MTDFRLGRLLLTNDDGIDQPGLAVLEEIAAAIADEVWVVAPEHDQSGTSCSVSFHTPLRLRQHGTRRFAVKGTPADCVLVALHHLMAGKPPDAVLSGINIGANLGDDVVFSGTVGAALAASLFGRPAVAVSQSYRSRDGVDWAVARAWLPRVLGKLLHPHPVAGCFSVNIPDAAPQQIAGLAIARQGVASIGVEIDGRCDTRGAEYYWLRFNRGPGQPVAAGDAAALRSRRIAVTPLTCDWTHVDGFAALAARLEAEEAHADG